MKLCYLSGRALWAAGSGHLAASEYPVIYRGLASTLSAITLYPDTPMKSAIQPDPEPHTSPSSQGPC